MAGEFAQSPVPQGPGGGHGQHLVRLGLPGPVRLPGGRGRTHTHHQGTPPPSPRRLPHPAAGRLRVWASEGPGETTGGLGIRGPCSSQTSVPLRAPQEPQGHLSEDASMKSSLPFIPRATTQRPQSGLKTFLEAHSILEQVDRSPSSWSQKLVSPCWQRLLEHPCPAGGRAPWG